MKRLNGHRLTVLRSEGPDGQQIVTGHCSCEYFAESTRDEGEIREAYRLHLDEEAESAELFERLKVAEGAR